MVLAVDAHRQRQHHRRHAHRHNDARQHKTCGNGVNVIACIGDAIGNDVCHASCDIAAVSQQQEHARVHNVETEDFFQQIAVKEEHAEADAEEDDGHALFIVVQKILEHAVHLTAPPF